MHKTFSILIACAAVLLGCGRDRSAKVAEMIEVCWVSSKKADKGYADIKVGDIQTEEYRLTEADRQNGITWAAQAVWQYAYRSRIGNPWQDFTGVVDIVERDGALSFMDGGAATDDDFGCRYAD